MTYTPKTIRDAEITAHAAIATNVHGTGAGNDVTSDAELATHAAMTTNVHGTGAGNVIVGDDELAGYSKIAQGSYDGNSTANRAIPHGLGVAPLFIKCVNDRNIVIITDGRANGIYYQDGSTVALPITVIDSTNFYVGHVSNYTLSANLGHWDWEAFT